MRGHHARAIEQLRQCLALDQTFWLAHFALGNVYSLRGDNPSAIEAYERAMQHAAFPPLIGSLAAAYVTAGAVDRGRALLEASPPPVRTKALMFYHFGVSEFEQAASYLDELIHDRDPHVIWIGCAPEAWRQSPSVDVMLGKIGLA